MKNIDVIAMKPKCSMPKTTNCDLQLPPAAPEQRTSCLSLGILLGMWIRAVSSSNVHTCNPTNRASPGNPMDVFVQL